jgi:hypothetical protein
MLSKDILGATEQLVWEVVDFPHRLRNYFRRRISKMSLFSLETLESDSEVTFYESAVEKIIRDQKSFQRFRRIYDYREILEHVNFKQGRIYYNSIQNDKSWNQDYLQAVKTNDSIGNPRKFSYPLIGRISPTTLRYCFTALDIQEKLGKRYFSGIAEIGGGYGGQAMVLNRMNSFRDYYVYDLPNVQELIKIYTLQLGCDKINFPKLNDVKEKHYDLVISNYAFSELPRALQIEYLEKVIVKAKSGYMLMNSGRTNVTGRSAGKLSLEEIRSYIPNLIIADENPKTSPDNYLIFWKP